MNKQNLITLLEIAVVEANKDYEKLANEAYASGSIGDALIREFTEGKAVGIAYALQIVKEFA